MTVWIAFENILTTREKLSLVIVAESKFYYIRFLSESCRWIIAGTLALRQSFDQYLCSYINSYWSEHFRTNSIKIKQYEYIC